MTMSDYMSDYIRREDALAAVERAGQDLQALRAAVEAVPGAHVAVACAVDPRPAGEEIRKLREDLHDCRNELCYRCGAYQGRHMGACDGCRWSPWVK